MNENISKLLKKIQEDEEIQKKFEGVDSAEKFYEIALTIQDGYSYEEFVEAMKSLKQDTDVELSDEDMEKVAGGHSYTASDIGRTIITYATLGLG